MEDKAPNESVSGTEPETRKERLSIRTQQEQEAKRAAKGAVGAFRVSTTSLPSPRGTRASVRSSIQQPGDSESSDTSAFSALTPNQRRKSRAVDGTGAFRVSTTPLSSPRGTRSSARSSIQQPENNESSDTSSVFSALTASQTRNSRDSLRSREETEAKARAAVDGTAFRSTREEQDESPALRDEEAKRRAGAFRVGIDEDESAKFESETFSETPKAGGETMVEAIVAPDLQAEVEAALQFVREAANNEAEHLRRRVAELERVNDPEKGGHGATATIAPAGIVVAVADGADDESVDDSVEEEGASKRRKIRNCGLLLLVLAVAGGAAAGVLSGGGSGESAPAKSEREIKLEGILSDHTPSNDEAFTWLAETDTWEPPEDATNAESLWLERYAMATIYHSTNGDMWTKNDSWLSEKPVCDWFMRDWDLAHCNRDKQVTRLELWQDNLSGSIPSELALMSALTYLSLRNNNLGGTIPKELGDLTDLVYLNFHVNSISGIIPIEYGSLTGLTTLHMHDNILTGKIPTELGALVAMTDLELYNNGLTGTVPTELSNMTDLEFLYLYVNKLSGNIPELPPSLTFCMLAKSDFTDYTERNCFEDTASALSLGCDLTSNCASSGNTGNAD